VHFKENRHISQIGSYSSSLLLLELLKAYQTQSYRTSPSAQINLYPVFEITASTLHLKTESMFEKHYAKRLLILVFNA